MHYEVTDKATRDDKLAANNLAFVQLASIRLRCALTSPRPSGLPLGGGMKRTSAAEH